MKNRSLVGTLRRRQLDTCLADIAQLRRAKRPQRGWIFEIRKALGMSAAQMGARVGVGQSTIARMEQTEREETISLKSLRRIAEAIDCDLLYALVPRISLETVLEQQARLQATRQVGRVAHTMALEAQALSEADIDEKVRDLASEMVRTMSPEIWRDDERK